MVGLRPRVTVRVGQMVAIEAPHAYEIQDVRSDDPTVLAPVKSQSEIARFRAARAGDSLISGLTSQCVGGGTENARCQLALIAVR